MITRSNDSSLTLASAWNRTKFRFTFWWQFTKWTYDNRRNAWIEHPEIKVYARKARRWRDGEWCHVLEMASVEVREDVRRQGRLSMALQLFETAARARRWVGVFVEEVHNPDLRAALMRRGYVEEQHGLWKPSNKR